MAGFPRRPPPPPRRLPIVGGPPVATPTLPVLDSRPGRVLCLIGPKGSGKSLLLRTIVGASERSVVWTDFEGVEQAREEGADTILVEGMPASPADVQALYDARYVTPDDGAIFRLDRHIIRDNHFLTALPAIEAAILKLQLRYLTIHNDADPTDPVLEICARMGITS